MGSSGGLAVGAAFAAGAAARWVAFASGIGGALEFDPLVVPAAASAPCRREAAFLLRRGLHSSAGADGAACAGLPPLQLAWHAWAHGLSLPAVAAHGEFVGILALELACAALLLLHGGSSSAAGRLACAALLLSPWNVAACAAGSTAALHSLLVLVAAHAALRGATLVAAAALAVATALCLDHAWLLPALLCVVVAAPPPSPTPEAATATAEAAAAAAETAAAAAETAAETAAAVGMAAVCSLHALGQPSASACARSRG